MASASPPVPMAGISQATSLPESEDMPTKESSDNDRRIYILGTGSIGKFIAHSINNHPNASPVTLLFHKASYLYDFRKPENGSRLNITTHGNPNVTGPFDSELILPERRRQATNPQPSTELLERRGLTQGYEDATFAAPIHHLVVTTKAHYTTKALLPLKHRLNENSTILFLQNGCGTVEEVNQHIFPDPSERPHYMVGINSHGVHATGPASAVHAGRGVIYIGAIEHDRKQSAADVEDLQLPDTSRYLLRSFTHLPILAALPVPPSTLTLHQLDKLAVNCVINPLTVLLDAPNGSILNNHNLSRTMRLLLFEISAIFRRLPEVQGIPNIDVRFSPDRLEDMVVSVARKTSENISSMLQDVRRGVETEIDYLNGWVVRRGESVDVKAVVNYSMVTLVKGKQNMISREVEGWSPFEGRGRL